MPGRFAAATAIRPRASERAKRFRVSRAAARGYRAPDIARSQTKVGETEVRLFAGAGSWHEVMPWQEATRRRPSKPTCQSWSWELAGVLPRYRPAAQFRALAVRDLGGRCRP
jgi:hypothetical protein